jgi:hypothetical protein
MVMKLSEKRTARIDPPIAFACSPCTAAGTVAAQPSFDVEHGAPTQLYSETRGRASPKTTEGGIFGKKVLMPVVPCFSYLHRGVWVLIDLGSKKHHKIRAQKEEAPIYPTNLGPTPVQK